MPQTLPMQQVSPVAYAMLLESAKHSKSCSAILHSKTSGWLWLPQTTGMRHTSELQSCRTPAAHRTQIQKLAWYPSLPSVSEGPMPRSAHGTHTSQSDTQQTCPVREPPVRFQHGCDSHMHESTLCCPNSMTQPRHCQRNCSTITSN